MLPKTLTAVTNDCFTIGAMNLGSRIKIAINMAGMTPPQLARASGVEVATINALINRDSRRSEYTEKLVAALPGHKVNLDWVRSGQGDKHPTPDLHLVVGKEDSSAKASAGSANHLNEPSDKGVGDSPIRAWEHPSELPPGNRVFIPKLGIVVSGEGVDQKVEAVLSKAEVKAFDADDWIRDDQITPSGLGWSRAADASMETVIFQGDSYVVDTTQTDVIDGKTYAIHFGGTSTAHRVRKLFRLPGGGLKVEANNKEYPTQELTPEACKFVTILGRVVHRAGSGGL